MSKNFKSFIISCLISISTIGVMGTTSFADDIEGTERFIPIGEGEISMPSEKEDTSGKKTAKTKTSGTLSSPHKSSLSMGNQLIEGKYRSFPAGLHTISMTVTYKSSPNSGMPNYCKVTLQ